VTYGWRAEKDVLWPACTYKQVVGTAPGRRPVFLARASAETASRFLHVLVAEWLACWTQAQKGPGSNRSRDAVG